MLIYGFLLAFMFSSSISIHHSGFHHVRRSARSVDDVKKNKLMEENLKCHNNFRRVHGVEPLSYNEELNDQAQKYADWLAYRGKDLIHSMGPYGENLFYSFGYKRTGYLACKNWYDENKLYNYTLDNPTNFKVVGHFTQMVWKNSRFTGFGIATSKRGETYIVSLYDPPGNVESDFRNNVLQPTLYEKGQASSLVRWTGLNLVLWILLVVFLCD